MNYEVRKLPRKTIIIIGVISFIAFGIFIGLKILKEQKMSEILATVGHKNVSSLKVVNKLSVEDMQTRMKSSVYKVAFFDNDLQQKCVGFIHLEKNNSYTKDLDCK